MTLIFILFLLPFFLFSFFTENAESVWGFWETEWAKKNTPGHLNKQKWQAERWETVGRHTHTHSEAGHCGKELERLSGSIQCIDIFRFTKKRKKKLFLLLVLSLPPPLFCCPNIFAVNSQMVLKQPWWKILQSQRWRLFFGVFLHDFFVLHSWNSVQTMLVFQDGWLCSQVKRERWHRQNTFWK